MIDGNGVASQSQKFLDLVEDMDMLLACHEGFLIGSWLEVQSSLHKMKNKKDK